MATHVLEATPLDAVELPGALNYGHDVDSKLSTGSALAGSWMLHTLEQAKGLNVLRQSADPLVTRAAFLANVEKHVAKFEREAEEGLTRARHAVATSLNGAEGKLRSTVGISPSGNAAEIRSVFRSMSVEQRQTALAEAFREGNKEIIGAIVGFDKVMHGCNPDYVVAAFDEYQRKVAPNEYAAVEAHKKYVGYLDRAGPSLMAFTTRALKGTGGYIEKAATTKAVLASYGVKYED